VALACYGNVKEAYKKLEEAEKLAKTLKHQPTLEMIPLFHFVFEEHIGGKLDMNAAIYAREICLKTYWMAPIADIFCGMALSESGTSQEEKLHGLDLVMNSVIRFSHINHQAPLLMAGPILIAHLNARKYKSGLEWSKDIMNRIEESGINANLADTLKLTGDLVVLQMEIEDDLTLEEEALKWYNQALQKSNEYEIKVLEINIHQSLLKLWKKLGKKEQFQETRNTLSSLYDELRLNSGKHKVPLLEEVADTLIHLTLD